MRFDELRKQILGKQKGTFSHFVWAKQLHPKKAYSNLTIVKVTEGTARTGVNYDNMGAVKAKRESGILPIENAGLPWGTWKEYPYFIEHKGNNYVRLSLDKNNKLKSVYLINGKVVDRETAKGYCLKSDFPDNVNTPDVITISTENIISVK